FGLTAELRVRLVVRLDDRPFGPARPAGADSACNSRQRVCTTQAGSGGAATGAGGTASAGLSAGVTSPQADRQSDAGTASHATAGILQVVPAKFGHAAA